MILIISEDNAQATQLQHYLQGVTEQIETCRSYDAAVQRCTHHHYSVILLELQTEVRLDIAVLQQLQQKQPEAAILVLSPHGCESERILFLELGTQDYFTAPYNPAELQARVRVELRRARALKTSQPQDNSAIQIGGFCIDTTYHRAEVNGQYLSLTATEFTLLYFLARHPDQVFSRSQLLSAVWGYNFAGYEHTVNSHINRLRSKLSKIKQGKDLVKTVWGVGYKLDSAFARCAVSAA